MVIFFQSNSLFIDEIKQCNDSIRKIGYLLGRGTDEAERGAPKNVGFE